MKPLILTGCLIPDFIKADVADLAVDPYFRFVWGQLPSPDELAAYLGPRTSDNSPAGGRHWSDFASRWGTEQKQKSSGSQPGRILPAIRDRRTLVRHASARSIATDLAARLLPFLPRHRGQVEIASARPGSDRDVPGRIGRVAAAAHRRHRAGTRNGKRGMASVSGDDAGSLFRSAQERFERIVVA
jgi:hypothetical protein